MVVELEPAETVAPLMGLVVAELVTVPCNAAGAEFGVQPANLNEPIRVCQLSPPSIVGWGDW